MKKSAILFGAAAILSLASCKKETTETNTETSGADTTTVEQTVTTEETTVSATTADTSAADGTSVSIGSDGVKVDSKNGDNQTKVDVSADGGSVTTKK